LLVGMLAGLLLAILVVATPSRVQAGTQGLPEVEAGVCEFGTSALSEAYVALIAVHQRLKDEVDQAVELHRQARDAIRVGQGCNLTTIEVQKKSLGGLELLSLDDDYRDAALLADCAMQLQSAAETEMGTTTNLNRRGILQTRIDTARFVRGQSLRVAGEVAYMRDRRLRLVDELVENIEACAD